MSLPLSLPLFSADTVLLYLHLSTALLALLLGPAALYRRHRDRVHRMVGYTWVTLMATTALAALGLEAHVLPIAFGFGPIHTLCLLVLGVLWRGVAAARCGQIDLHQRLMRSLYWQALGITGLFTLVPGRLLNRVLFPDLPQAAWVVIVLGGFAIALGALRRRHQPASA